jgi:cytochrome c5
MKSAFATTISLVAALLLVLPVMTSAEEAPPPAPCQGKQSISMVKAACSKGGQKAAKKAMKSWVRSTKKKHKAAGETDFKLTCKTCHTKLKGAYPIKKDAVATYKKLKAWKAPAGSLDSSTLDGLADHIQSLSP